MVNSVHRLVKPVRNGGASRCVRWAPFLFCLPGVLLLMTFAATAAAIPATPRWDAFADKVFQHYTVDQGLPVPTVTALAQDGAGFIWVGTQGGLARFDGYRFKIFKPEPGNPAALPGNYISTLHTDTAGRLWLGTVAGGLARVEGEHFIVYNKERGGLRGVSVRAITNDGAGGIWVATEGGLDHLNAAGEVLSRSMGGVNSEPVDIQSLLYGRNRTLWVGTRSGLFRYDADSGDFFPLVLTRAHEQAVSISALFEDDEGRLWIGTARNGVFVKDNAASPPRPVQESDAGQEVLSTLSIGAIIAAGPHEVWIGTYGFGVIVVDTRDFTTHRLRHNPVLNGSLMHDDIWALLRDRAGTLWAGTGYGLDKLINGHDAILTLFGGHDISHGPGGADVSAVYAMADGSVWLGFRSGAVQIFDPVHGRIARLTPDAAQPESALPEVYIRAFAATGSAMYIGTNRGLYQADLEKRQVRRIIVPGQAATALVNSLCVDAGILWIAGLDNGLHALPLTPEAKPVISHLAPSALTDTRISAMVRGQGQDLWIATYSGLNRLDLATGKIEQIHPEPKNPDGLPTGVITTLVMDQTGRLWAGLAGGGIAVLQNGGETPKFHRIGTVNGLPNANVDTLLLDQTGQVWASTENGLAVIDPSTFAVRALHKAAGAVITTYWAGSGTVTAHGELVFGGYGGITVVRPSRIVTWTYQPPIAVTDLTVDGHALKWVPDDPASALPIRVPAESNKLEVEFAVLDYTAPQSNRYAYRLDGFDPDWIETDSERRLAVYTNLPPGNYQLHLRGSNRDGVWSERTLNLPIEVEAAWYQTLAFKLLLAFVIFVAVIAIIQIRTAYLRRRQQQLQDEIQARTEEVQARTEEVLREKSAVKRLEQAEKVQRALYTIADLTSSSIERREMLQRMHRIVDYLIYAENFYIALYHRHRKTLRFVYFADVKDPTVFDPDREIPEAELANSATLKLIHRGEPMRGPSETIRTRLDIAKGEGQGPEADAWLGVPMINAGEVRGAIVVQSYNKDIQYTEADQELLLFVAEHILTALMRREAKEELEKQVASRTRELAQANEDLRNEIREREAGERLQSVLFRIAELSGSSDNVSEFIKAVHSEIGKLLYAQNFYVGLLVDDDTALEYPYAVDEYDPGALFQRDKLGHGLTEYVLRTGKPLLALPETTEALIQAGEVERTGTPSVCWLGVPLLFGDRIAGVLVVQSYTPGVVYSTRDQQLLTFVSLHIATALQRRKRPTAE